jgi:hypothetical protein
LGQFSKTLILKIKGRETKVDAVLLDFFFLSPIFRIFEGKGVIPAT